MEFKAKLLTAKIDETVEDELPVEELEQEFSGKGTSLLPSQMKNKRPALFNKPISWPKSGRVFDIGAGRPEMAQSLRDWFSSMDVTYLPYDKFNGDSYNSDTIKELKKERADVATASNLLNVIPGKDNRINVIRQMYNALKPGGKFYITVHFTPGKQPGQTGKDQWQNHMTTSAYLDEVKEVFPNASVSKGMITGTK